MKRLPQCLFAFLVLIALSGNAVEIYIATNGLDTNPGTKNKPLATLVTALRKASELRRLIDLSITNGIHIILLGGTYPIYEPIFIRTEEAGTTTSPTFIEAAPGEQPVLSGGVNIKGWKKLATSVTGLPANAKDKVWVADVSLMTGKLFELPYYAWANRMKTDMTVWMPLNTVKEN